MAKDLKSQYKTINRDDFPTRLRLSFGDGDGFDQVLEYEKVEWEVDGQMAGLRYGENPDQKAALFRLRGSNLDIAGLEWVQGDQGLVSACELLQTGKHPGKTNLTDIDAALNILRYFSGKTACAIMKHNNPSGFALGASAAEAYSKAYWADRVAAFGGAVVLNRQVDAETARLIAESYCEVVAAPEFDGQAIEIFRKWKNLRVVRIRDIARLESFVGRTVLDFKSLMDGSLIVQNALVPSLRSAADFLPAETEYKGQLYKVEREPSQAELDDMVFGWLVETGVVSNSVIFVRDGVTLGIGTGEQDRVGVVEIAVYKAYRKLEDRLHFERYGEPFNQGKDEVKKEDIRREVAALHGGLKGSVMVSDAFFPFRDGPDAGFREGVSAIVQPGGGIRDFETIQACNDHGAAMKYTGQRCFKH